MGCKPGPYRFWCLESTLKKVGVGFTHLYPQYWGGRDDQTTSQLVYLLGNFQASERLSWKIKVNRASNLHMQCTHAHTCTWIGREREREDEPKVFQISSMASCPYPDITSSLVHMVNPPNDKTVSLYQPRGSKGRGLLHCALGGLSLLPEARHEHTSLTCGREAQAGVITEALPRSWLNGLQYRCWAQLIFAPLPCFNKTVNERK